MKKILFNLLGFVLLLPAWSAAQSMPPFTVLRNNTNIDTNYLYVEIMYERVPCDEHIAQFGFQDLNAVPTQADTTWAIRIDSILNNEGTYELNDDATLLMRPKAGGYKLRFKRADFPGDAATSDSVLICVKSSRVPFLCKGCAAAGSDALFAPEIGRDIDVACPYDLTKKDLLACYKRTSKAANWEAWIRDERDCKPYRIVLMPDSIWWLAQNLEYTKGLTDGVVANNLGNTASAAGYYWCPGSSNFDSIAANKSSPTTISNTVTTGGDTTCHTYGALYTQITALQEDGIFPFDTVAMLAKTVDTTHRSSIKGICPKGWLLPNNVDWGMMLNYVHGCTNDDIVAKRTYCRHHINPATIVADNATYQSPLAVSRLKSTISSRRDVAHGTTATVDTITATKTRPDWTWTSIDADNPEYKKNRAGNAQDAYGFSMLPAGYRYHSEFRYLGKGASFQTSTFYGTLVNLCGTNNVGRLRVFYNTEHAGGIFHYDASSGYYGPSVRCVAAAKYN